MMKTFSERLQYVLAGRKIYPWAESLGISKGAVFNIRSGTIFGPEILKAIRHRERISVDWLMFGDGKPFLVDHCDSVEALRRAWRQSGRQKAKIYLLSDGQQVVVIRQWSDIYEFKGKRQSYEHHQLLTLAFSDPVIQKLASLCKDLDCYEGQLSSDQLGELVRGEAGPFSIFGNNKIPGLLTVWRPLSVIELERKLQSIAEMQQPAQGEISRTLMRVVIEMVENTALEEGIVLDAEAKARVYTAQYRAAARAGLDWKDLDRNNIRSLLDML